MGCAFHGCEVRAGVFWSRAYACYFSPREANGRCGRAGRNGVAERRIADDLMLLFDRNQAGDQGRGALVAIFGNIEKFALLGFGEDRQSQIVQKQGYPAIPASGRHDPIDAIPAATSARVATPNGKVALGSVTQVATCEAIFFDIPRLSPRIGA